MSENSTQLCSTPLRLDFLACHCKRTEQLLFSSKSASETGLEPQKVTMHFFIDVSITGPVGKKPVKLSITDCYLPKSKCSPDIALCRLQANLRASVAWSQEQIQHERGSTGLQGFQPCSPTLAARAALAMLGRIYYSMKPWSGGSSPIFSRCCSVCSLPLNSGVGAPADCVFTLLWWSCRLEKG